MNFSGNKIKKMRESKKWTQKQLAARLMETGYFSGFTHQRVQQLETGDNASHRAICALCEVFKCNPNVFFEK